MSGDIEIVGVAPGTQAEADAHYSRLSPAEREAEADAIVAYLTAHVDEIPRGDAAYYLTDRQLKRFPTGDDEANAALGDFDGI